MAKYTVDWYDYTYPKIVLADEGEGKSFTECKDEIIRHFQWDRDFARGQIQHYRNLKLSDVE